MSHAGKLSKTPTRLSFLAAIERLNNRKGGRDECETVPRLWGPWLIAIRAVQMATRGRSLIVVHLRSLSWKSLSEGALGRRIIEYDVKVSIVLRIRAFKGARWKLGQIAINLVQRERERERESGTWAAERANLLKRTGAPTEEGSVFETSIVRARGGGWWMMTLSSDEDRVARRGRRRRRRRIFGVVGVLDEIENGGTLLCWLKAWCGCLCFGFSRAW